MFIFDGKTISALPLSMGKSSMSPAIVAMPGDVPFLFLADYKALNSVPLSGQNAGKWFDAKPINFTDSIFQNLAPSPGFGTGSSSSSSGSKSGVLAGVLCAVAALIIGVGAFVWYRKRSAQNNKLQPTVAGASKV